MSKEIYEYTKEETEECQRECLKAALKPLDLENLLNTEDYSEGDVLCNIIKAFGEIGKAKEKYAQKIREKNPDYSVFDPYIEEEFILATAVQGSVQGLSAEDMHPYNRIGQAAMYYAKAIQLLDCMSTIESAAEDVHFFSGDTRALLKAIKGFQ